MTEEYTALDLETTGLNPKKDKIIEIGAVKVREGRIMDSFQCFVNPWRKLGEETRLLTGIDDGMLQDAPGIEEVLEPLIDFIGEDVLVGHRILFDYSFVKKAAVNRSLVFEKEGIDTLKLARKLLPDLESRKLGDLCNYYGISIAYGFQKRLEDAEASSGLYQKLAELFYKGNEEAFMPRKLLFEAKKEMPVTKRQKERLYKLLDRHRITIEYQVDKLTKSEADRIMDQIVAKYGR